VAQVASKKLIPTLGALEKGCLEKVAPIFLAFPPRHQALDVHPEFRNKRHVACMQMSERSPFRTNKLHGSNTQKFSDLSSALLTIPSDSTESTIQASSRHSFSSSLRRASASAETLVLLPENARKTKLSKRKEESANGVNEAAAQVPYDIKRRVQLIVARVNGELA